MCVKLIADIDLSDYPDFQPIGTNSRPFYGTFDGGEHKITLALYRDTLASFNYASLFGYCTNATIKNLTLEGTVYSSTDAAALVYRLDGNGTLENIINRAAITAGMDAAGIAIYANGSMTNCFNYGAITSTAALVYNNQQGDTNRYSVYTGKASGLFGGAAGTITGCENHGTVEAKYRTAGIAGTLSTAYGQATSTVVSKCVNTESVTSYGDVASDYGSYLSGTHLQEYNTSGGIIACVYNEGIYLITGCVNSGTISGSGNNVGGILGTVGIPSTPNAVFKVSVTNCKNSGNIINTYDGDINLDKVNVGGIVGNAVGSTGSGAAQTTGFTVSGNENTGAITAKEGTNVSSIVGRDTWTNDPNGVTYENTDNTTDKYYGNDEYKDGVSEKEKDPDPTPSPPQDPGNNGDGGGSGDGEGSVKDPEAPKVPAGVTTDKPAEVQKIPAAEGPVKEQDVNYEHRPASAAERIDLEERPQEEALRVDEDTNEEAPPEDQPNENPLDVAAGDIERTAENSPFMAVALGVAGAGGLGGGGYALFRLLRRRRLG